MAHKQATILIQYHFDAVSMWLNRHGYYRIPGKHSRGMFGVNVGVPRILDIHDRLDIPSTWFIPGHTIDSFPEICAEIWDRNYDIQHHGWAHANQNSFDTKEDVISDMERGIESIKKLTGRRPKGYSSSRVGIFTDRTITALEELNFEWDSSMMGNDFRPYYVQKNKISEPNKPFELGKKTDIIEIPLSYRLDDTPYFMFAKGLNMGRPVTNEKEVFDVWKNQFDWMYENVEDGIYNLVMHPQLIGMAPLPTYLEELIQHIQNKSNVEFKTFSEVVKDIKNTSRYGI